MGNAVGRSRSEERKEAAKSSIYRSSLLASFNGNFGYLSSLFSSKKNKREDFTDDDTSFISEEAIAAALLLRHHQRNGSLPFPRSSPVIHPSPPRPRGQGLPRSSSAGAPRPPAGRLQRQNQLVNQDVNIDNLETNHFVLVHGGGFGAWCWYKTIALLEEAGFRVDAIDLTGSGVHSADTKSITSLNEYVKPLTEFFDKLGEHEKVILVGHDIWGACISYIMGLFPSKVAKAVFLAGTMLSSGQSALDVLSQQIGSPELMQKAKSFPYGNGEGRPPAAIDIDKEFLIELLFNQSSTKDVALASVLMRPIPFAPVLEKLSLSDNNYGSIPRFYIKTQQHGPINVSLQEAMIRASPPLQVFQIKGSDHAPFFSKPQSLHRILVEISQEPRKECRKIETPLLNHSLNMSRNLAHWRRQQMSWHNVQNRSKLADQTTIHCSNVNHHVHPYATERCSLCVPHALKVLASCCHR